MANLLSARDRIGPNAIIQVIAAMTGRFDQRVMEQFFESIGLLGYVRESPQDMVPERDVAVLQRALFDQWGDLLARDISREAGRRTGDYLLRHRIPNLAQRALRMLPAAISARLLLRAIGRHAWTFAGSGVFAIHGSPPFGFSIQHNPLCSRIQSDQPVCDYYAATFERIFQAIVHPCARVRELSCEAVGAPICSFEISWR